MADSGIKAIAATSGRAQVVFEKIGTRALAGDPVIKQERSSQDLYSP
jgi:hypothetical protein